VTPYDAAGTAARFICYEWRRMRKLNRGQRIVAVVAWAVVLWFVGSFVSTLGEPGAFGWVAYAPLSRAVYSGPGLTLTPLEDLLVWLALVVAWVGGSMLLLRVQRAQEDGAPKV
jgi:heme/copper-type cytochrome/quinol oxidase subunit 1